MKYTWYEIYIYLADTFIEWLTKEVKHKMSEYRDLNKENNPQEWKHL